MDEERRTSANLKACIREARDRVAFINTGFLDRTGDEIHTSMQAGPMVRKADMRNSELDQGLRGRQRRHRAGLRLQRAGPDRQGHVGCSGQHGGHAGAEGRPPARRRRLRLGSLADRRHPARHPLPPGGRRCPAGRARRQAPLDPAAAAHHPGRRPRATGPPRTGSNELDNNIQSTLGYVVRWVNDGVGCSKVPDIHGTAPDGGPCHLPHQLTSTSPTGFCTAS